MSLNRIAEKAEEPCNQERNADIGTQHPYEELLVVRAS